MAYLIDTNIILRMAQPNHLMCTEALNALGILRQRKEDCYLTHQNLVEFWRSATRPVERNGLGMSLAEAEAELKRLETLFPILPDIPEIYPEWKRLVLKYGVMGVNVHDARLVAVIIAHGLTHILTFNLKDFARYANEITPVHPTKI
ncbi:putative nucleic acid-binding protein, contains PIN domain [Cylindrospermum stagnale PCC 7417]|uniref:Putative nucleic acid-binding protein, contains PIN domain n=1 Tax=Cylindrospermum stagnale PCC 7417 TaxID=56107 RepID=K9X4C8_9NOST|nr:type II toxin-antitoxin system VapC family toxin [Cylindrospermum stagnale]AFZ27323.1 putative nucleic acid-binding protein, contains PIN domain [Cylindrospermum stagnale PCC 7417]